VGDYRFRLLDHLLTLPNDLTLPTLKLDPISDPLRADLAFQKLCEEKAAVNPSCVKAWEIIGDNLSKTGWSWRCVSAINANGRTFWIADAPR
jgi:hypothetical protein